MLLGSQVQKVCNPKYRPGTHSPQRLTPRVTVGWRAKHLGLRDSLLFGPGWQEGLGPNPMHLLFCAEVFFPAVVAESKATEYQVQSGMYLTQYQILPSDHLPPLNLFTAN